MAVHFTINFIVFLNGFFLYLQNRCILYMYTYLEIISVYIQNVQYYIDITTGLYYYKSTRQLELGCLWQKQLNSRIIYETGGRK